ncbi:unnamed protein product [Amoebophrya sp. A25]|nr:unnamed protein product [Amoebophrya sp. A25]|eukprot:GSA25T00014738001.1
MCFCGCTYDEHEDCQAQIAASVLKMKRGSLKKPVVGRSQCMGSRSSCDKNNSSNFTTTSARAPASSSTTTSDISSRSSAASAELEEVQVVVSSTRTSTPTPPRTLCACKEFRFIPSRPEEVGEWWLVRRKGFDVRTWRAKCRCGAPHTEHHPVTMDRKAAPRGKSSTEMVETSTTTTQQKHKNLLPSTSTIRARMAAAEPKRAASCRFFTSAFCCVVCNQPGEDHETVWETERERREAGFVIGEAFLPLHGDPDLRDLVLHGEIKSARPFSKVGGL